MTTLLTVENLSKHFGGLYALNELSFAVDEHEIVSIIGPNGAGKSTVFNVITGLYRPDGGDIVFRGESILDRAPSQIVRLGIARTFQNVKLFPNMTVLENAMVGQHCRSRSGVFGAVFRTPGQRREEERIRERAVRRWASSARGSPATGRTSRRSCCRTRTGAGSRWRARWRPSRPSCCSTSRRPA